MLKKIIKRNVELAAMFQLADEEHAKALLPSLVKMLYRMNIESNSEFRAEADVRRDLQAIVLNYPETNFIVSALKADFVSVLADLRSFVELKKKVSKFDGKLEPPDSDCARAFELSDVNAKLRLIYSELMYLKISIDGNQVLPAFRFYELFDDAVYLDDVAVLFAVSIMEFSSLLGVEVLCQLLLHYRGGVRIIKRIMVNFRPSLLQVCRYLIQNGETNDEVSLYGRQQCQVLFELACLDKSNIPAIVNYCVEQCKMPSLLIQLLVLQSEESNEIGLLCSTLMNIFLGRRSASTKSWLVHHFQNTPKLKMSTVELSTVRLKKLLYHAVDLLLAEIRTSHLPDNAVFSAVSLLKCFAALKSICQMSFSDKTNELLELLCSCTNVSSSCVSFIEVSLSLLCGWGSLLSNNGDDTTCDRMIEQWLTWLISVEKDFESLGGVGYQEMLLLIAIHFHSNNQYHLLSQLVQSVLGFKVSVRQNSVTRVRSCFLTVFTEQVVAERAARVTVTANLSANNTGYLPVHCVHQLLKSRIFSKHQIVIKDWIINQLRQCVLPLHSVIVQLIDAYVHSCLNFTNADHSLINDPIDQTDLKQCFVQNCLDESQLVFRVVLMYYVLYYDEYWLSQVKSAAAAKITLMRYSSDVIETIPVKFLFERVKLNAASFGMIYPNLQKLITMQFQYLFTPTEPLTMSHCKLVVPNFDSSVCDVTLSAENLGTYLATSDQTSGRVKSIILIKQLLQKSDSELLNYIETIVNSLPFLVSHNIPNIVLVGVVQVWEKLESLIPRRLYQHTVSALLVKDKSLKQKFMPHGLLSHREICLDPLSVLRCHLGVFRCAPILEIILRMLNSYLLASRIELQRQLIANPPPVNVNPQMQENVDREREELFRALIGAQESTALQILLEVCQELDNEQNAQVSKLSVIREIRCIICAFLHQRFIGETLLMKLVHFQGYPHDLIPVTVNGVASMHVCFDFIPELIQQPDFDKQLFAIDLISQLSVKYPITRAMTCSRLAINLCNTLLCKLDSEHLLVFFNHSVKPLARIANVFPPLSPEIVSLLLQVGRIAINRLSLNAGCSPQNTDFTVDEIGSTKLELLMVSGDDKAAGLLNDLKEIFSTVLVQNTVLR